MAHEIVHSKSMVLAEMLCERVREMNASTGDNADWRTLGREITETFLCRVQVLREAVWRGSASDVHAESFYAVLLAMHEAVQYAVDTLYRYYLHDALNEKIFNQVSEALKRVQRRVKEHFEGLLSCLGRYHHYTSTDGYQWLLNPQDKQLDKLQRDFLSLHNATVVQKYMLKIQASAHLTRACERGQIFRICSDTEVTGMVLPDGKQVFVIWGRAGHLSIWDKTTGDLVSSVQGLTGTVTVVVSTDGGALAVTTDTSTVICLYESSTGALTQVLEGHSSPVRGAAWSPDGSVLTSFSAGGHVCFWDVAEGTELHQGKFKLAIEQISGIFWSLRSTALQLVVFSASEALIVTLRSPDACSRSESDCKLVRTGLHCKETPIESPVRCTAAFKVSKQQQRCSALGYSFPVACANMAVCIMDVHGRINEQTGHVMREHAAEVTALQLSSDDCMLASCSADGTTCLWRCCGGLWQQGMHLLHVLQGHASQVNCVAWSPDGCRVVTGSNDGTARVWNVATGALERTLQRDSTNPSPVISVAFSGRDMFVCYEDGEVRVWRGKLGPF